MTDPKAALIAADQAVSDCQLSNALTHLCHYWESRGRGEFEPEVYGQRGDKFAASVFTRIESQQAQANA